MRLYTNYSVLTLEELEERVQKHRDTIERLSSLGFSHRANSLVLNEIEKEINRRKKVDMNNKSSYMPTRKWFVRTITAISGLLIMWVSTGSWDQEETIGLITLVTGALASYLIPNDSENLNSP